MINKTRKWIIRISVALTAVFCACGAAACGAPKQLDMPENLQLDGRMLTWDEVEDADGYAVYVDDQEYIVEDNAFEIPFLAGPKTYQVEVMALGDWKKTKDSVCGEIEYTKVLAEENVTLTESLKIKQAPTLVSVNGGEAEKFVSVPNIKKFIQATVAAN